MHGTAHDEVVPAPAVVGTIAIAGECSPELRGRERGHLVAQAAIGHVGQHLIEVTQGVVQHGHVFRVLAHLVVMVVEAPQAHHEQLALHAQIGVLIASHQPRHHLQLQRQWVQFALPCGGADVGQQWVFLWAADTFGAPG
jgi:hypothetical protein